MHDTMVVTKQTQSPRDERQCSRAQGSTQYIKITHTQYSCKDRAHGTIDLEPPLNRGTITLKATQEKENNHVP